MWDDDDSEIMPYPKALLASADSESIPSPTKRQKIAKKGRKRAPKHRPELHPQDPESEGIQTEDTQPHEPILAEDGHGEEEESFGGADIDIDYHYDIQSDVATDVIRVKENPSNIELYIDAVTSGVAGFKHVHSKFCVVQGWDYQRTQANVKSILMLPCDYQRLKQLQNHWHHMQFETIDGKFKTACTCPTATRRICVHQQYFEEMKIGEQVGANTGAS